MEFPVVGLAFFAAVETGKALVTLAQSARVHTTGAFRSTAGFGGLASRCSSLGVTGRALLLLQAHNVSHDFARDKRLIGVFDLLGDVPHALSLCPSQRQLARLLGRPPEVGIGQPGKAG